MNRYMDLSVVLCTWNNSPRLKVTLDSFLLLEIDNLFEWELVVVNNNSTDATPEVVSSFSDRLPIKYIVEPRQGLSHARNAGLLSASGDLIVFTDDDIKPCRNWLTTYWQAYKLNPEGSFWGGPVESDFESSNVNPALLPYAPASVRGLDLGSEVRKLGAKEYFISANWACPLAVLKKVGTFNVAKGLNPTSKRLSIGEETDLMDRLRLQGFNAIYLPLAQISHFVPKEKSSLRHIASRAKAWGFYCGEEEFLNIQEGRKFFGVPLWLYREVASAIFGFLYAMLKFRIDYRRYLECCHLLGYIGAIRKLGEGRK